MRSISIECLGIILPRFTKFLYGEISISLLADLKETPDKYLWIGDLNIGKIQLETTKLIHKFSDIPSTILAGCRGYRERVWQAHLKFFMKE